MNWGFFVVVLVSFSVVGGGYFCSVVEVFECVEYESAEEDFDYGLDVGVV